MIFALGPVPSPPTTPVKDNKLSTSNSIAVYWTKITTDVLPVFGYRLYADSGLDDKFNLVFDGSNLPEQVSFNFTNPSIDTSLTYRFYVTGINYNGEGAPSNIAYFKPCTMPTLLSAPIITNLT